MAKPMDEKKTDKVGYRLDTLKTALSKGQDGVVAHKGNVWRKRIVATVREIQKRKQKELKASGNGTFEFPFKIKVGKRFKIDREENGTTGLGWQAATTREIKLTRTKISPSEEAKLKLLGAGGQQIWSFQAKRKGIGFVFLVYKPTWLPEDPITDQQEFIYYDVSK